MTLYRDEGVVLRLHKLGEADRIVTILTRRTGKVRAVAKGVRRTSSRFGARLEPASHVDAQFFLGKSLDIVTQVESIRPYGAQIVDDYPRHTAAAAILEAADRLSGEEREPSLRLFLLLIGALRSLAEREKPPRLVLDAFLVRGMSVAGWEPALTVCARCDKPGPHRRYSVESGGTTCTACAVPRAVTVLAETPGYIEALLTGDWTAAESATARVRREASGVLAAHMQWHLERSLRSLPYVERESREARDETPAADRPVDGIPMDASWPVTT